MGHNGNAAAGNRGAGGTVDGRLVDGIQVAGSPEDDVQVAGFRAVVTPEDVNQVDDARHWEAGNPEVANQVVGIREGANLEAGFLPPVVWLAADQPLAAPGSPQAVYLVLLSAGLQDESPV